MNRLGAPYVTPWTGEAIAPLPVTVTTVGAAYEDPVADAIARDQDGVLWAVCRGMATGKPEYAAELHPERQKATMEGFLCACCRKPAARDDRGMLWVLPFLGEPESWEGVQSAIPPMCEQCARTVPRLCPELREGHVQLRVREAELVGVRGTLYPRPDRPGVPDPDALVLYDSPGLPFVVARQVVRELRQVTVVAFSAAIH
ncbi:hypothetical protein [Streptomyces hirsutus]|uniref:hypothetical protein n=1 Tax=Streptomyces hirsutus TaxID=35620 RepID=UPI00331A2894